MDPKKYTDLDTTEADGVPPIEAEDWEGLEGEELDTEDALGNGDLRYEEDDLDEPSEEDDDNPYQESDEALPDDDEEAAIARDPGKLGSRFEEG